MSRPNSKRALRRHHMRRVQLKRYRSRLNWQADRMELRDGRVFPVFREEPLHVIYRYGRFHASLVTKEYLYKNFRWSRSSIGSWKYHGISRYRDPWFDYDGKWDRHKKCNKWRWDGREESELFLSPPARFIRGEGKFNRSV